MAGIPFYPEIQPFDSGQLAVDGRHRLYWEQCGNPKGVPILFLHGGPGAGAGPVHRRFFDPDHYRIVIFDQRGAGRSEPVGEIVDNTTPLLIQDIETLRRKFGIERWHVFGGSWGSTLSIAYAEAHPERVLSLVLRGIFLCRRSEINWFLYGMRTIAPEAWRAFAGYLPPDERGDLLTNFYKRLIDPDPNVHMPAARAWSQYEGSNMTLMPSPETVAAFREERLAKGLARLEAHYFIHDIFMPENSLFENLGRIRKIPTSIVQGRYDLVCPIVTADELTQAWPEARYTVISDAGHSAMEDGIRTALIAATNRMREI
ncbi:MAG: prolyl aminopeptidase [Dongiaceae bacterium]